MSSTSNVIRLADVSKKYGNQFALQNISYSVEPGTVFALLGENGAGKTTTIKIFLGLTQPDVGTVEILGLSPKKDVEAIRSRVGYVPEVPSLYDWTTVAETGRFSAAFYDAPRIYWQEYERLIRSFGLPMQSRIKDLSKGMRAKVSLAVALASDPELLVLDEPTSGLDAIVRREFMESMVDRAAIGKTVFLSSHQIGEVERVADHVAIMKQSRLLLVEPTESLKATSSLLYLTLAEEVQSLEALNAVVPNVFQTTVLTKFRGRSVEIFGRNLLPNFAELLKERGETIVQFEVRQPTLEDVFVAYMERG